MQARRFRTCLLLTFRPEASLSDKTSGTNEKGSYAVVIHEVEECVITDLLNRVLQVLQRPSACRISRRHNAARRPCRVPGIRRYPIHQGLTVTPA